MMSLSFQDALQKNKVKLSFFVKLENEMVELARSAHYNIFDESVAFLKEFMVFCFILNRLEHEYFTSSPLPPM